jgi:hypothetical protein
MLSADPRRSVELRQNHLKLGEIRLDRLVRHNGPHHRNECAHDRCDEMANNSSSFGLHTGLDVSLANVAPIRALLGQGCYLEADVPMAAVPSVSGLGGWRPWGQGWATT